MCFELELFIKLCRIVLLWLGYYLSNITYTTPVLHFEAKWECENQFLVHLIALTDVYVEKL